MRAGPRRRARPRRKPNDSPPLPPRLGGGYQGNPDIDFFNQNKKDRDLRKRFDPRFIEDDLEERNQEAAKTAQRFKDAVLEKPLAAGAQTFEGGFGDQAMDTDAAERKKEGHTAPPLFWDRVPRDLDLSSRLIAHLDKEKDLHVEMEAVFASVEDDLLRLDTQLEYLWHVHGVNYYAGAELDWFNYFRRLEQVRQVRREKPAEEKKETAKADTPEKPATPAEEASEMDTEKQEGAAPEEAPAPQQQQENGGAAMETDKGKPAAGFRTAKIDRTWEERLERGEKAVKMIGKDKVEEILKEFVDGHIEQMEEEKFGCKLCTKLFRGADFVRRHITNKHQDACEEIKEKAIDEVYQMNVVHDRETKRARDRRAQRGQGRGRGRGPMGYGGPMMGGFGRGMPMGGPMMGGPGFPMPGMPMLPKGGRPHKYNDLDAPQEGRTVLDYGDL